MSQPEPRSVDRSQMIAAVRAQLVVDRQRAAVVLQIIVIADGVASMYGDDLHVFGLQNVSRCLGWVLTADEFLHLLGTTPAGIPQRASPLTGEVLG